MTLHVTARQLVAPREILAAMQLVHELPPAAILYSNTLEALRHDICVAAGKCWAGE